MSRYSKVFLATAILVIAGCASLPNGPSVMVLPGTGMSFNQFRNDDVICQQYASFQVGGTTPNQAGVNSGVTSAAVGTALGAAAGAAIGGGSGAASSSMYEAQQRFDVAYIQCMYAKGHQVPVSGQFSGAPQQQPVAPAANIPPPPPGTPPPPPPHRN